MTDPSKAEDHERLPERWVQGIEAVWDACIDPDDLAAMRSMVRQPPDEYLAAVVLVLRRLSFATMFRIDGYLPLDDRVLTEDDRALVREAMTATAQARALLSQAIGVARFAELERQRLTSQPKKRE